MKFKSKNPFLIKFNNKNLSAALILLQSALEGTIALVPGFKVEGLNTKARPNEKKVPHLEIREGNDYVEMGEYVKKAEINAFGVGVSSKYNVSLENLGEYKVSACLPIYSLPVYSLEKDFDKILDLLFDYVTEVAPKPKKKATCEVTYHSNFIRVGHSRIDYDDTKAIKKVLGKKSPKKDDYVLKRIIIS